MLKTNSVLDEALRIAELGYPVLPCNRDKQPILRAWPENATTDPAQIRQWFMHPDRLLAVKTGPDSDLFVLDVDPNGMEWLARNQERMLCERVHETRRGKHFLYRFSDALSGVKSNTAGKVHAGVDTRGEGGCLIWWPAHGLGASGDLTNLTEPPSWLIDALVRDIPTNESPVSGSDRLVTEGGRNSALASLCGRLWASGQSKEEMREGALRFNAEQNLPPVEIREVDQVVESISRYPRVTKANAARSSVHTEDSLALSFVQNSAHLRYVDTWGKWVHWDGSVWAVDTTLQTEDEIRRHLRLVASDEKKFQRAQAVAAVARLARSDRRFVATPDQWDSNDNFLNTPAGVFNLSDGSVSPPDPLLYMSKITAVAPAGEAPRWDAFIDQVTDGDREYQSFLQRVAGYAASGHTHEHAIFFLHGEGANGKSVFLNTIQEIMGGYATVASMDAFTESKYDRHPTDMAMLQGARLVFAQETDSHKAWAESRIKSITGGDLITARRMRQDFFTFRPKFKLLVSGNHVPRLRNVDESMQRRLNLLPFIRTFKGADRDLLLAKKLREEHSGILKWIIDGAISYHQQGLVAPKVVKRSTESYLESEDFFQHWLRDCCTQNATLHDSPTRLYQSFKERSLAGSEVVITEREFRQKLQKAGFIPGNSRSKDGRFWQGLRVKD